MNITYAVIIAIVAYIFGAITKVFIDSIPNRYIPIQNVAIGIISGLTCYFAKIEPNLFNSIVMCLLATMGAGGVADLVKAVKNKGGE